MEVSSFWWVQPSVTSTFWWVQPSVTAVGIFVAGAAIYSSRNASRLKATLDFIEGSESKEYYQTRYKAYRKYRTDGAYRISVLDPKDLTHENDRDYCLDFLNHYEAVAIACDKGIIDKNFYYKWMGENFVRDWNVATDLVRQTRMPRMPGDRGCPTAFQNFERLAVKWKGTPIAIAPRAGWFPLIARA